MVHPRGRGYVHRTVLLFNFSQNNSYDLRTQQQIHPSSLTVHLAAVPFLQSLSYDLSCSSFPYKTLCAHSCRGRPCTQLGLDLKTPKLDLFSSHQMILISLDDLDIFTWVPIYTSALLQNQGLTPENYGQLPKEGFDSTPTPLRLFWVITLLTNLHKTRWVTKTKDL